MREALTKAITSTLDELGIKSDNIVVEAPDDLKRGDYASPVAFSLAKQYGKNPKALAETIASHLQKNLPEGVEKIEATGGFVNFFLSPKYLSKIISDASKSKDFGHGKLFAKKKVMIEYGSPNLFKPLHIGHLMSLSIGESLSRLIEFQDAKIARVSYPSDIGLSVAKGIWGLEKTKGDPNDIKALGVAYKIGNDAYEDAKENNGAKKEIEEINRSLYDNSNKEWNGLRKAGLKVSLKHLLEICRELGTKFDLEFFESEAAPVGQTIVEKNIGGVFEKSDGAIIFKGEKHDLHTRVFITREGLPTYETKELGLFELKRKTLPDFNLSITVTSVEQNEYFKVLRAVIGEIFKDELNGREVRHIGHGFLRLPSGKMSSRKGNVVTGESLIEEMKKMALEKMRERPFSEGQKEKIAEQVAVAAIKFSILKQKIGKDIVFDPEQSLSFEGDSGPYLQYAHTRCASILKKAQQQNQSQNKSAAPTKSAPHLLERLVVQFPDVTLRAATEEAPQLVVTYLVNLASAFNHFYASEKIIGSPDENHLLNIVSAVKAVLKNGLWLLGIEALEEM